MNRQLTKGEGQMFAFIFKMQQTRGLAAAYGLSGLHTFGKQSWDSTRATESNFGPTGPSLGL